MVKHDIVYVLKQGVRPDELRYSLRSVCKNFKYNTIWFYGGCPKGIVPDHYVNFKQTGRNKWERARSTFRAICENDEITPQFYLFNDDFYIMKPYDQETARVNGTIDMQIRRICNKHNGGTSYTTRLRVSERALIEEDIDTISYETHTPMLIDREKGLELLDVFNINATFRSAYGNYFQVGGVILHDSKIVDVDEEPDKSIEILSSSDNSFKNGKIGQYIRNKFRAKCKYEIEPGVKDNAPG